ncbi:ABC transporter permease subunit [Streptosporangium amethystogenes]|uniref:ABC transporter permease subunit n=1 Tax=Streptosporangium amethystogenes TaxID=2002 RepID=UPI000690F83B|nr:ATP-binding cassette domain-containing protein [Streptosporangium amethystogenes]
MNELTFILIGIGTGSLYALVAQGLVLIFRGSGIVNFAQGAFALFGAYVYYNVAEHAGASLLVCLLVSVAATGLLGVLVQLLVLMPMRRASSLSRLIVTLGVLVTIQAAAVVIYGDRNLVVRSLLPTNGIELLPGARIGADRIIILAIGLVTTAVLWAVFRYTSYGRVTTAVAQSPRTAATLGHSPDRIAAVNWGVGGAVSGLAGALIVPLTNLEPINLPLIVLPALAAALVGGFASFPLAFVAALLIGVAESLMALHLNQPGVSQSVPFLVVMVLLMVRGRGLPLRSHLLDRLPGVGDGRVRPVPVLVVVALVALAMLTSGEAASYLTVTVTMAILCLSVVVVTGYAGQVSLAQYVLGGVGAFVAATLSSGHGMPFLACLALAVLATMILGGLVGVPALRLRGINLAIVGLGLSVAVYSLLLNNERYSGGVDGIPVEPVTILGWEVDPFFHPERYALLCLAALVVVALMVSNLRRGDIGRRLLALRSSERAAASLGVNVYWCKIYAFMIAAGIAALGGTLFAFMQSIVLTAQFGVMSSVNLITVTVVGGIGSLPGALVGATLIPGGLGTWLLNGAGLQVWLPLIGGVSVLLVLRADQGGLADLNVGLYRSLRDRLRSLGNAAEVSSDHPEPDHPEPAPGTRRDISPVRVSPLELRVEDLGVRYGGVVALEGVNLRVKPGTVHGIMGPNGAGKTSLVDALTGFAQVAAGTAYLGDRRLDGCSPMRRSRLGLRRSFQSVELFSSLTTRDNIAIGCDDGAPSSYITGLLWPKGPRLSEAAEAALEKFGLSRVLDAPVESLSFGDRRLVAIARAVASAPSVILLDEPASGLADRESAELAALVRSLADDWGMAVLLVEHNINLVLSVSDEITVLQAGRVLAHGTPAEISADQSVVDAYLGQSTTPGEVVIS